MDTTNFNPAIPSSTGANKTDGKILNAGATALAGGVVGSVLPHAIGKVKQAIESTTEAPAEYSEGNTEQATSTPSWADEKISVATGVNDAMSFNEAFAAARAEVGAGGAFDWRCNVYGTYYAEEWNSMSASEKSDFNDHFSWNHLESSDNSTASNYIADNTIEVVSVDHSGSSVHQTATEVEVMSAQPEIEVLGVVHDMQTGSNIGGLSVDGQDVFLIDVDGDLEFDLMASDLNQNNIVDEGEIVDIHGQGMTVDHLGGISEISEGLNGDDDLPDYMADNTYEI